MPRAAYMNQAVSWVIGCRAKQTKVREMMTASPEPKIRKIAVT